MWGKEERLMEETIVLRKNKDIVSRVIDDETILLPLYKSSEEINCIYTLNKIASQVWELIDGKRTLGEIKKIILRKFDTTPEEVDKEMEKFLKDLKEIKAIVYPVR
jgi:tRNA uridine 5-carbamoylmethylation protein Kti12